jgi:hypothetical protein
MDSNETNRIIFQWLHPDQCWHAWRPDAQIHYFRCSKCDETRGSLYVDEQHDGNPSYSSSLDAISVAEKKALESDLGRAYVRILAEAVFINADRWSRANEEWQKVLMTPADAFMLATAPAEVRASAIRKLIEENL